MSKKDVTNADIRDYILNDYVYDATLVKTDEFIKNIDMLVSNNLAIKMSGVDDIFPGYATKFNAICYFMCKKNKKNNKFRKKVKDSDYKGYADSSDEIRKFNEYLLEKGTYYAMLGKSDYAVLNIGDSDSKDDYLISYSFYIIGNKCLKYKDEIFDILTKYKDIQKKNRPERIAYSDGRYKNDVRFKSFDQVIFDDKEKILKYIDNWVNNIPTYYKYGMTPKLSILLYGKPGTGKSTFYKALAKYLELSTVCCILPGYFMNDSQMSNSSMGRGRSIPNTIFAIDDIDCICESRENNKDKENSKTLSNLLAFLDAPDTFYFKAKDGIFYPVSIVVASTNYYDRLDEAVKRFGRFDLTIEMKYFDKNEAEKMCKTYDLTLDDVLEKRVYNAKDFTISPAELQALCMENIDKSLKK